MNNAGCIGALGRFPLEPADGMASVATTRFTRRQSEEAVMYRLFCVFALAAAGSLFASSAMAAVIPFHVTLDGAQAGVVTPASGSADLLLDDVADTLGINLVYADLLAPTTN